MRRVVRALLMAVAGVAAFSLMWVLAYRFVDPPATFLMLRDRWRGTPVDYRPIDLAAMGRHLPRAVIGAEDAHFCYHHGFDLEAMEQAWKRNASGGRLRGGSTISQQTAKNAFLWPGRTLLRKGIEAWFTLWIELLWGKPRIMEAYLNIVELGRGIYGVEAAARHYFGKPAAGLSRTEAARIAAILPQPVKRDAGSPGRYTRRYASRIEKRARVVANEGIDACLRAGRSSQ
jgi:monofunctional biosynthetic peptidoglycan transglycosylase